MLRYYPQYCLSAFVATAILFVMYFMKRNFRTRKNRIFLIMLTDNLLASGINITTFYVISFPERYPLWADYLSNLVYLSIYNLMAVLFLLYVDSATKIPHMKLPVRIIAGIIACYDLLIIWTTPFTHLVSYFDEELNYRHGPLMVSLYVTAFIAVFTANIMFLRMRKSFNSYQVFSITCFVFGIFGSVMFQAFHPKHVISNFACAMALFFLYTAFENQAYYLYGDTPCYNKKAFIRTIHRMKKLEKPYGVLAVKIEEFENCIHALGRVGAEQLPERIAERISLEFGKMAYCTKIVSQLMRDLGSIPSPFNSFLLNLGLESLHLRMARHCSNAQEVAEYLREHPKVAWVHYPGLRGDANYDLAQKYLPNGSCGVMALGLKGDKDTAIRFMDSLKMINIVTHVADARTCVLHPASHTHRQLTDEQLKQAGIAPDLIRLSVGIEDVEDIISDLRQALAQE